MKWSSVWTLPLLWMYLGPPILRAPTGRSAMESVAGQFDTWNIMRLVWWLACGAIAVLAIYQHQRHVKAFVRVMPQGVLWSVVFLSTLVASSAYSPAQLFTLANGVMIVVLAIAAFDLGLRLYAGTIELDAVLRGLLVFSLIVLGMIMTALIVAPGMVSGVWGFGLRVSGGNIGDSTLVAAVVLFTSLYFLSRGAGRASVWYVAWLAVSVVMILLGQTRTAYVGVALGLAYFGLQWLVLASSRARVYALGLALLLAGLVPPAVLVIDTVTGSSSVATALGYLVRDERSLRTASGRTAVSSILLENVSERPWGLGYSAGPRVLLQTSFSELAEQGVRAEGIGNAHNIYLEVLGGSGVLGLFAFLAVFVWVGLNLLQVRQPGSVVVRVLFVYVALAGLTASNGVLPFYQPSVLLWCVFGIAFGLNGLRHPAVLRGRRSAVKPQGYVTGGQGRTA